MKVMEIAQTDLEALIREKYNGDRGAVALPHDLERLRAGEPLAYVIGHIPFLGLRINLDSHPLIPRPETEWWTEELCKHIGEKATHVLDLCAGSGAIGLAILKHCPNTTVSFGELTEEHEATIQKNIETNGLDASRADIRMGDLFAPFSYCPKRGFGFGGLRLGQAANAFRFGIRMHNSAISKRKSVRSGPPNPKPSVLFDIIATNPPYIPENRPLDESVSSFEPREALFSGEDGLSSIRRIIAEAPTYLKEHGELWMECDIENIEEAEKLAKNAFSQTKIHTDQYGRPRLLVAQL